MTNSLENRLLPKKNDIIIIRWKPKQMIKDSITIFFSDKYSGAIVLFIAQCIYRVGARGLQGREEAGDESENRT